MLSTASNRLLFAMKRRVLTGMTFLALATMLHHATPVTLAMESSKVVSTDNALLGETQEVIELNGAKPIVGSGPSN